MKLPIWSPLDPKAREPVRTITELRRLDEAECANGYFTAKRGGACPGHASRAFWHGWRNGMCDFHGVPADQAQCDLAMQLAKARSALEQEPEGRWMI